MCRQLQYCRNRTNTCADICSRNRTNSKRSIAAPPHWSLWRILGCLHTSSQNSIAFSFIWAERCTRQRWGKLRAFRGRCWFKGERCPGQRLAPIFFLYERTTWLSAVRTGLNNLKMQMSLLNYLCLYTRDWITKNRQQLMIKIFTKQILFGNARLREWASAWYHCLGCCDLGKNDKKG